MGDALLTAARAIVAARVGYPCCEFTARTLILAYDLPHTLGDAWGRDMNIRDPARPWSPMDAALAAPGGEVVDAPVPGRWHLVQGWRRLTIDGRVPPLEPQPRRNGHAWFWWALTPERGWALESDVTLGIRWMGIHLGTRPRDGEDDLCGPGDSWAERIEPFAAGVQLVALPPPPVSRVLRPQP